MNCLDSGHGCFVIAKSTFPFRSGTERNASIVASLFNFFDAHDNYFSNEKNASANRANSVDYQPRCRMLREPIRRTERLIVRFEIH